MAQIDRRDFLGLTAGAVLVGCGGGENVPPNVPGKGVTQAPGVARTGPLALAYFGAFGVDETLIKQGLAAAMSRGADFADLYFQHKVTTYVALQDGEVNRAFTKVDLGVGVRAVKGDQTGYGYTEELTLDAIKKAGATAAAVASGPAQPAPVAFAVASLPKRYVPERAWSGVSAAERIPLLTKAAERATKEDPRVKKVNVMLNDEHGAILIVDSQGRVFEDMTPSSFFMVRVTADDGKGRRESNSFNLSSRRGLEFYSDEKIAHAAKEAVARTTVLFEAQPAPLGEMQVVLAPGASGILLHEAIGHGMEADFNRKNTSIFSDRIGKPVAKDFVSIVDDGTIDNARGTINVDDEGNAPEKTMLVEKGILATYMHDSISAKHYGVKPTGSGRRESFRHVPMPRMRSTYMLGGPHGDDEIIKSVKKGVYCSVFTNGQVNIGPGDFTFYVKNGFLIEDGKLTRPVTDVNLIGNGPKVLEKIDMVGSKMEFDEGGWTCGKNGQGVPVSLGMPMCRVASITVGGRKA